MSASVPRILAEYNLGLALALVCAIIFVAGLLPVLGKNYQQTGLGLGIATLLAFALQTDTGTPGQTVAAALVGVVFVVLLRILMKARDPSDVARALAAAALTEPDPGFEDAYLMWLRDRPVQWLGDCLRGAVEYRTIRPLLGVDDAVTAERRADEVSKIVAAREPRDPTASTSPLPATATASTAALGEALEALDRVEDSARRRDTTKVGGAAAARRAFARASVRSALTWRSQTLRHGARLPRRTAMAHSHCLDSPGEGSKLI